MEIDLPRQMAKSLDKDLSEEVEMVIIYKKNS
jgi:hypothetical protein